MEDFEYGENPENTKERPHTMDAVHRRAKRALRAKEDPKLKETDVFEIPKGHSLLKKNKKTKKRRKRR